MRSRLWRIVLLLPTLLLLVSATLTGAAPGGVQTPSRTTDECTPPGLEILTDPAGDALDTLESHDVTKLSIGEPAFDPAASKVVFTLKVVSLADIPPQTTWPVAFDAPGDPDPAAPSRWVAMTTSPPFGTAVTPAFIYGDGGVSAALADGTLDAESNFNADGTITLVASYDKIGNPTVGGTLVGFLTRIRDDAVAVSITPDNMPDDLAPAGSYTLVGNCGPTAVELTSFRARSEQGRVAVTWRTASQAGVLGFNLWRSGTKVNRALVPARGGLSGASYRFVDRRVQPGKAYTYRLQLVHRDGARSWHGAATVRAR
ncbi:MAG: hypothetical protein ABR521_05300 [Gaiellaceae bacterium]